MARHAAPANGIAHAGDYGKPYCDMASHAVAKFL